MGACDDDTPRSVIQITLFVWMYAEVQAKGPGRADGISPSPGIKDFRFLGDAVCEIISVKSVLCVVLENGL